MADETSKPAEKEKAVVPGTQFLKNFELPDTVCTTAHSIQSIITVDNGKYLWACCNEGTVVVWDSRTGSILGSRQAHKATIFDMICVSNTFNPYARDSCTVWAASLDSTITVWNSSLSIVKRMLLGQSSTTALVQVDRNVWVADATNLFVLDSQTHELATTITLPSFEYLKASTQTSTLPRLGLTKGLHTDTLMPSPSVLNVGSSGPAPSIRSRPSASSGSSSANLGHFVRCLAVVGDHVWVCTDNWICFVDKHTFLVVPSVHIAIPKINSLVYIKNANSVWGACSDGSIYVWDADAPSKKGEVESVRQLSGWTTERVSKLVNLDDKFVYSGSWDRLLRIWDAQTGTLVHTQQKPHECPVMAVVLLPYPWLRVYGTRSSPSNTAVTPTETRRENGKIAAPMSSDREAMFRVNSVDSALSSSSNNAFNTDSEVEMAQIVTVLTADWSSISLWV